MNWIAAFDWPQTLALAGTSCLVVSAAAVWIASRLPTHQLHLRHQILFSALLACCIAACTGLSIAATRWTPLSVAIASSQRPPLVDLESTVTSLEVLADSTPYTQSKVHGSDYSSEQIGAITELTDSQEIGGVPNSGPQMKQGAAGQGLKVADIFLAVWAIGAMLMLAHFLRAQTRCMLLLWRSKEITDDQVLQLAEKLSLDLGLRYCPEIRLTHQLSGPAILGLFRPILLIPQGSLEKLDQRVLRHVLLHELAHVQRRDNSTVYLAALTKALFWPIPTMHWLCAALEQAREELCDEFVLRNGQAFEYVESLIQVARLAHIPQNTPQLAVGMVARKGAFEQRVERILTAGQQTQSSVGAWTRFAVLAVAIIAASTISTLRFSMADSPAQEGLSKVSPDEKALPPKANQERLTKKISVTGFVRNKLGNPVSGAKVYLATTNWRDRLVAQTTTNDQGQYSFEDATVELYKLAPDSVSIMVFATAKGEPIGWEGMKTIYFNNPNLNFPPHMENRIFFPGDAIKVDVEFGRASPMYGQVKDMNGKPLPNAKITLRKLDYLDTTDRETHVNYREFYCRGLMPKEFREATTTEDGTFVLQKLPAGTYAMLQVEHEKHATRIIYVANMPGRRREFDRPDGSTVSIVGGKQVPKVLTVPTEMQTHPILLELKPTQPVKVHVVDEQGQPLEGMSVRLYSKDRKNREDAFGGKSDATGTVDFRAAAGEYSLVVRPPLKTDRIETKLNWTVKKDVANETEVKLKLGGIVVFKAVDGSTGAPIAGIGFSVRKGDQISGLNSVPHYVDHPTTDKNGELRVLMKPGTHSIDAGFKVQPESYRADKHMRAVKVESGKVHRLKFEFRN